MEASRKSAATAAATCLKPSRRGKAVGMRQAKSRAETQWTARGAGAARGAGGARPVVYGPVHATHEHRFRPQTPGSLTLRQFVESLRRWTPEMRQIAQIALTRTEAERARYLQQFHAGHHQRSGGTLDSFVRWAYSDPRLDAVPALLADLDRPESDYAGALEHEAEVLVAMRGEGKPAAQRVHDYLALLGVEGSEQVKAGLASLMPLRTPEPVVVATLRLMRRRWLERYGDDPFFAED